MDLDSLISKLLSVAERQGEQKRYERGLARDLEMKKFHAENARENRKLDQADAERQRLMDMTRLQSDTQRYGYDKGFEGSKYGHDANLKGMGMQHGMGGSQDRAKYMEMMGANALNQSASADRRFMAEQQRQATVDAARERGLSDFATRMMIDRNMAPDEAGRAYNQFSAASRAQKKSPVDFGATDTTPATAHELPAGTQPNQRPPGLLDQYTRWYNNISSTPIGYGMGLQGINQLVEGSYRLGDKVFQKPLQWLTTPRR